MPDIRREFKGREVQPPSREREQLLAPTPERSAEVSERQLGAEAPAVPGVGLSTPAAQVVTTTLQKEVASILEEGLQSLYLELQPPERAAFKVKGEETANKISQLMRQVKVKVQEIIKLLIEWLKLLPGVSKYFVEQEAKIKAEKILKLKG